MLRNYLLIFIFAGALAGGWAQAAPAKWRNQTSGGTPVPAPAPAKSADPEKDAFYKRLQDLKDRWQAAKSLGYSEISAGNRETLLVSSSVIINDFITFKNSTQGKPDLPVSEIEYPLVDMYLFVAEQKSKLNQPDWEASVNAALATYPGNAYAMRMKLTALLAQNKKEEAVAFFEAQLPDYASGKKSASYLADPFNLVIAALIDDKNLDKANALLSTAVATAPNGRKREFLYLQSKALASQARYTEALAAVNAALPLHTYPPPTLKELKAAMLTQTGDKEAAAVILEDLCTSGYASDIPKYIYSLATIYLEMGKLSEAGETIKKILAVEQLPRSFISPFFAMAEKLEDKTILLGLYVKYRSSSFVPATEYLQDEINLWVELGNSAEALQVLNALQFRVSDEKTKDWIKAKIQVLSATGQ